MEETWKDIYYIDILTEEIIDYRGLYQVSNLGRVKSLNYRRTGKEKILKQKTNKKGYKNVNLSNNTNKKMFLVHRLVAYMFIPNNNKEKWQINHKDENPSNNCIKNLEWCTNEYNQNYGGHNERANETKRGKPRSGLIDRFDDRGNYIDTHYQFEYANMGFNPSFISACCLWYKCSENKSEWFKIRKDKPRKRVGLNGKKFIFKYHKGEDKNEYERY